MSSDEKDNEVKLPLLSQYWSAYVAQVLPPNPAEAHLRAAKNAWWGGAAAALGILTSCSFPEVPEDLGVEVLDNMHLEVDAFMQEAKQRVLLNNKPLGTA